MREKLLMVMSFDSHRWIVAAVYNVMRLGSKCGLECPRSRLPLANDDDVIRGLGPMNMMYCCNIYVM